jgi:ribose-phosphate pyrophosphokinase
MILFSFPNYEHMAKPLAELPRIRAGEFTITRFDNQELCARVQTPVSGEACGIVGSVAPPDAQMLSLMLLAHTLKKDGARRVTAILPYLAYSRQDKNKPGESLATGWLGSLLKASGFDEVLTVDVHSKHDKELFPLPLVSLSTAELFAAAIRKWRLTDATIVAPDNGAICRCQALKRAAAMPVAETPYFEKRRTAAGITHHGPIGKVGARAVLLDDILDTGGTLVSACEKLLAAQVEEMYILVTHGLFTGTSWKRLWSLCVRRIFCTDTVPLPAGVEATILPVAPLLQEALSSMTS